MISVPSRQPLLSGNNCLLLLALGLLLSSCALFQPAETVEQPSDEKEELDPIPGKKIYDPETGTLVIVDQTPTEAMDTIKWTDIPTDSIPPIVSTTEEVEDLTGNPSELLRRGEFGTEFYSAYNVAVMLPFLGDRFSPTATSIYDNSTWALNFYGGIKMAMEELDDEGLKVNLTVMDTKASERETSRLLSSRSELFNAHTIIGPYRSDNVRLVADFAKRNNITMVSPHSAASNISSNNPNYIQVSPTLETHCRAITRHVRERYNTDQVVLVVRDKPAEKARLEYFHSENARIEESALVDSVRFYEYIVEDKGNGQFGSINLYPLVDPRGTTVFVIPSWSNERFIHSFMAYAKAARGTYGEIVIYGMPQWMEYELADFELYEALNVHVSTDTYIDYYNTDIRFFRKRFFDRYGVPPTNEAFLGYDVSKYVGRMLQKHGTKFQYYMSQDPGSMLHTDFQFERITKDMTSRVENPPIERFGNEYVHILKFQNYQFQAAD